jgi:hypothetical protein
VQFYTTGLAKYNLLPTSLFANYDYRTNVFVTRGNTFKFLIPRLLLALGLIS